MHRKVSKKFLLTILIMFNVMLFFLKIPTDCQTQMTKEEVRFARFVFIDYFRFENKANSR